MANLADAVKAHRAAEAAYERAKVDAAARVRRARQSREAARLRLAEAMVTAARDGMRQTDIIATTGYSRERVRTILRAGGIEAD